MRTTCPNCGAPIEFRYDDSFVRVCASCHNAVLRTDRSVESLGKVADLVPMESPLALFAEGHHGSVSFLLVGMAQIRHEAGGLWQEWYAKLDGGLWGWLAEAQGRYYLTFEEPWLAAPTELAVGQRVDVPYRGTTRAMTVGEVTSATYVTARGELPFKLVPNETFRYADLSDGQGTFATIDFGDAETPPKLYVGQQVNVGDLHLTGGEVGPPAGGEIKSQRLACPVCNAPIELRAPGESLRAVCGYCNTLLDTTSGALAILGKLAQKAQPAIPLGKVGTFSEGPLTVIGFVQRSALVEGTWWPFDEYLLYAPGVGFRWLVQSDGHWSYVQPIATGAVEATVKGVRYDGISFARYQQAKLRVDQVLGEFYWQVREGETVEGEDSIAPPAMISRETSATEATDSLSTYLTVREVEHAFADAKADAELQLASPTGIAPNQPDAWRAASTVMALAFMALIVLGLVFAMAARDDQKFYKSVSLGGGPGPSSAAAAQAQSTPVVSVWVAPETVPECVEFKAVYDASLGCDKLAAAQHEAYQAVFDATFIASDRDALVAGCKTSTDMMHQALDGRCKLPTHEQLAAGSGSGSGAGLGAGSGSGAASEVTTAPADSVFFSDPIQIDAGRNIKIAFAAPTLSNDWVYIAADLVDEATGTVVSGEANMEYYAGVDDGEAWSEGTRTSSTVFGPQPEGTYVLRLEAQHGSAGLMPITVKVEQGVFRGRWLGLAMLVLGVPLFFVGLISYFHEKKRWENSNAGKPPVTPVALLILAFVGVFVAIGYILKAFGQSSDD
ncbi:MAG: DUF4178 domain-containing protein [Kofleriaceae bacterium]